MPAKKKKSRKQHAPMIPLAPDFQRAITSGNVLKYKMITTGQAINLPLIPSVKQGLLKMWPKLCMLLEEQIRQDGLPECIIDLESEIYPHNDYNVQVTAIFSLIYLNKKYGSLSSNNQSLIATVFVVPTRASSDITPSSEAKPLSETTQS